MLYPASSTGRIGTTTIYLCCWFLYSFRSVSASTSAAATATTATTAPWQDTATQREPSPFGDHTALPPNTFEPDGRLYIIEDLVHAVASDTDPSSNTVVVALCQDGVVAVTSLPSSPYMSYENAEDFDDADETETATSPSLLLLDTHELSVHPTAVAPFCRVSFRTGKAATPILALTAGNAVDGQMLRRRLLTVAESARYSDLSSSSSNNADSDLSPARVARLLADQNQLRTMHFGQGRILAAAAMIWNANAVWRVDPAGQFWQCQACVSGRYTTRVERLVLEKLGDAVHIQGESSGDTNGTLERQDAWHAWSQLSTRQGLRIAAQCIAEAHDQSSVRLRAIILSRQDNRAAVQSFSQRDMAVLLSDLDAGQD
jgi:20S proteasome alpha/beta subunit